jgi:hypothetical protein
MALWIKQYVPAFSACHTMTGAADVKVSVFNTDSKNKMKESQNNAAQFENSGIQRFTLSPLVFLTNGEKSGKIEGKKTLINIRNRYKI